MTVPKIYPSILKIILSVLLFQFIFTEGQSQNYNPLYTESNFNNRSIDVNLTVGTLEGAGTVSNGSASYTIPIKMPPGTNGVVPKVSVNYNSMSGSGLIGYGWSISALSVISRVGTNIYFDDEINPVQLNSNDKFVLDGQRLIGKSGTYGTNGATYGKEMEDFATVYSYGSYGGGPEWFKMITKDGIEYEYGKTNLSRLKNEDNTKIFSWYLTKITHPDGNYIEYKYVYSTSIKEVKINEILYTGNSSTGQLPYNKIKFNYDFSRIDKNIQYQTGSKVDIYSILTRIAVFDENSTMVHEYKFNYAEDGINSYLREVIEYGLNSKRFNSTIFKYGDNPVHFQSNSLGVVAGQSVDLFSGDFDMDGYSDIMAATKAYSNGVNYHTGFKIYKRSASNSSYQQAYNMNFSGNLFHVVNNINQPLFHNFMISDYSGDHLDDIMTVKLQPSTNGSAIVKYFELYKSTSLGNTCTFTKTKIYPPSGQSSGHVTTQLGDGQFFFPGDFDGDGATDFLTLMVGGFDAVRGLYINFPSKNIYMKKISNLGFHLPAFWGSVDFHNVIDFNGDGRHELMLTKGNTTKIFEIEKHGSNYEVHSIYSAGFPTKWHRLYFGDFNGDRKTDILTRGSKTNNNVQWYMAYSKGNISGFNEVQYNFQHLPDITGSLSDDKLKIADFNSDGRSDIYHAWNHYEWGNSTSSKMDVYYSKGNPLFKRKHVSTGPLLGFVPLIQFDLNGDGKANLINRKAYWNPFNVFYLNKNGKELLLNKVKNGLNHITEWTYKNMNSGYTFYDYNYIGGNIPAIVTLRSSPIDLVYRFKASNGINGFFSHKYSYQNAKLHMEGKGLLGFKQIVDIDETNSSSIITRKKIFPNFSFGMDNIKKYDNGFENRFVYDNQLLSLGSKRYLHQIDNTIEVLRSPSSQDIQTINTDFIYDNYGNPTKTTKTIKVGNSNTLLETKTTDITYGQYATPVPAKPNSITNTILRSGQTSYSHITKLYYNSSTSYMYKRGKVYKKVDFYGLPKNVRTYYNYNTLGNKSRERIFTDGITNRDNNFYYDTKGRYVIRTRNPIYQNSYKTFDSKWGVPLTETNIGGLKMSYSYDEFGRLKNTDHRSTSNNILYSTQMGYFWDINSSMKSVYYTKRFHPGKPDIKIWYDILGRTLQKQTEGFQDQWITEKTTYDNHGNIKTKTAPFKSGESILTTTNNYDVHNRITSSVNTLGTNVYSYVYSNGNLITTLTNPASQVNSNTTDATGKTISITDYGGTLNKTYFSHGGLKSVIKGSSTLVSNEYDSYARQTKLIDVNSGTTSYVYDALGQLTNQTNANSQIHTMYYDRLGRITKKILPEGNTNFYYFASSSGVATNQLKKITSFAGGYTEEYSYDAIGRVQSKMEVIEGDVNVSTFSYNNFDDLISVDYPSGFGIKYKYDANGYLEKIKNQNESITLFENRGMNGYSQYKSYKLGNNRYSYQTFYHGFPTRYYTNGGIQDLRLTWNYQSKNLKKRYDAKKGKTENFNYDNINRLKQSYGTGLQTINTNFATNGNVSYKSDVGSYVYGLNKINAVSKISNSNSNITTLTQAASYNSFLQPTFISEGDYRLDYLYAADEQRIKSTLKLNGTVVNTKKYFDGFEKDITNGINQTLHYISAGENLIAIVKRIGNTDTYYYTYTDHLGSILTVTNSVGTKVAEQNFDAWGRKRNASTWTYNNIATPPSWLYRGYTNHEHLSQFKLINMNGRMYDPLVARMLSTDNYIHGGSQGYNRYTYALNNPLRYTDPNGEFLAVPFFAMAFIGDLTSNLINGISDPLGTAYKNASGAVNELNSILQVPIYQSQNTSITFGLSPLNLGLSYSASHRAGDITYNIGGSIGAFGGGLNAGATYSDGDFSFGLNGGIGNDGSSRIGGGLGYRGASVGITKFGIKDSQYNWIVGYQHKKGFRISTTNDAFLGSDAYRTAALEIGYGAHSVGFNLYTTAPPEDQYSDREGSHDTFDRDYESSLWGQNPLGTYSSGSRVYAGLYAGYNDGLTVSRFGVDAPWVQDGTQNFIHRWVVKTPYFNTNYGPPARPFYQNIIFNRWSLY